MENIKSFVISTVIILAISDIVLYITPKTSIQKSVKVSSSIILMMIFFLPIIKTFSFDIDDIELELSLPKNVSISEEINDSQIKYSTLEAKDTVENILIKNEYSYKNVEVIVNIKDENCIYISEIKIYTSNRFEEKERIINKEINSVFEIDGDFYED